MHWELGATLAGGVKTSGVFWIDYSTQSRPLSLTSSSSLFLLRSGFVQIGLLVIHIVLQTREASTPYFRGRARLKLKFHPFSQVSGDIFHITVLEFLRGKEFNNMPI